MSSYFYLQAEKNNLTARFLDKLESYANDTKELIYVLDKPLGEQKYTYSYSESLIVLSPKNKIAIINFGNNDNAFQNHVEDIIEDVGSISDKYLYKEIIGRPRTWKNTLFEINIKIEDFEKIGIFFDRLKLLDSSDKKKVELLISLFIGSINDIDRVKEKIPDTILDKVKQKIQLFDGDQTRFIYQKPQKKELSFKAYQALEKLNFFYTN